MPKSEWTKFWNYRPQYLVVCRKIHHNFSGYHLRLLAHFALFFGLNGYHLRLFFGPEFCSKNHSDYDLLFPLEIVIMVRYSQATVSSREFRWEDHDVHKEPT